MKDKTGLMSDDLYFKDKKTAFAWYGENGGQRQVSSFYTNIQSEGRKVRRLDVSEMLRKERPQLPRESDLSSQREEADTRKAVAAADREEMRRDNEQRELDKKWILRENSDIEVCAWTGLLRDTIAFRLDKALFELIHVVGGNTDRLADAKAVLDKAITDACNDISQSDEVSIDIDELEDAS